MPHGRKASGRDAQPGASHRLRRVFIDYVESFLFRRVNPAIPQSSFHTIAGFAIFALIFPYTKLCSPKINMKRIAFLFCLQLCGTGLWSCNFTDFNLLSVSQVGPNWVVNTRLCLGAGRTGGTVGCDAATMDLLFGIYGPAFGPVNILSWTPAAGLTSVHTGCFMPAFDAGPLPFSPYFTQASLYLQYDAMAFPLCAPGFTCNTSTAQCGNVHIECFDVSFTLDARPDSIVVFGAEGAGNPIAGCFPNADMRIVLTTLPIVWQNVSAVVNDRREVEIGWACLGAEAGDYFTVTRLDAETATWIPVGMQAANPALPEQSYHHTDQEAPPGEQVYRIERRGMNGEVSYSNPVTVWLSPEPFRVSPNPFRESLFIASGIPQSVQGTLRLFSAEGKLMLQKEGEFEEGMEIETGVMQPGIYFLELITRESVQRVKLMRE